MWINNGEKARKILLQNKIYIPLLWPNVLKNVTKDSIEYDFAENILPIPCDQRYDINDMESIIELLNKLID